MPEPITEIPAHIRALPEAEQGPALVKAIHDRKADVSRETRIAQMSGRGWGKATAMVQWIDELARAQAAAEERDAVLRNVAARGLTPPKADDTPLTVRWSCLKPTDPPTRVLYESQYGVVKQGVRPGYGHFLQIWKEER